MTWSSQNLTHLYFTNITNQVLSCVVENVRADSLISKMVLQVWAPSNTPSKTEKSNSSLTYKLSSLLSASRCPQFSCRHCCSSAVMPFSSPCCAQIINAIQGQHSIRDRTSGMIAGRHAMPQPVVHFLSRDEFKQEAFRGWD